MCCSSHLRPLKKKKKTGGAVLAEVTKDRDAFWMSKAEYQEQGLNVLKKLSTRTSN